MAADPLVVALDDSPREQGDYDAGQGASRHDRTP